MEKRLIYEFEAFIQKKDSSIPYNTFVYGLSKLLRECSNAYIFDRLKNLKYNLESLFKINSTIYFGQNMELKVDLESFYKDFKSFQTIIRHYLNGNIPKSFNSFIYWYNKNVILSTLKSSYNVDCMYRCRRRDENKINFDEKDMFHIPFEMRNIIGNERFSVNGLPAVYMGSSTYICWEELDRMPLSDAHFVSVFPTYNWNLFDMRLNRSFTCKEDCINWLKRLPLIIFCSFATSSRSGFKTEYIIPQILMLALKRNKLIDGVIYNSLKYDIRKLYANWEIYSGIMDNIVIPVKTSRKKGSCKKLAKLIAIGHPLSYDEMVTTIRRKEIPKSKSEKELFIESYQDELKIQCQKAYEKTYFYEMDVILKNAYSYKTIQYINGTPNKIFLL